MGCFETIPFCGIFWETQRQIIVGKEDTKGGKLRDLECEKLGPLKFTEKFSLALILSLPPLSDPGTPKMAISNLYQDSTFHYSFHYFSILRILLEADFLKYLCKICKTSQKDKTPSHRSTSKRTSTSTAFYLQNWKTQERDWCSLTPSSTIDYDLFTAEKYPC